MIVSQNAEHVFSGYLYNFTLMICLSKAENAVGDPERSSSGYGKGTLWFGFIHGIMNMLMIFVCF